MCAAESVRIAAMYYEYVVYEHCARAEVSGGRENGCVSNLIKGAQCVTHRMGLGDQQERSATQRVYFYFHIYSHVEAFLFFPLYCAYSSILPRSSH